MDASWSALILDDDPGVRQSVRLCLESDNARVVGIGTSSGALDALERSHFDVVFLDLWLQSESGLTVLPEILRRQPGVGIIVITAFATFESAVEPLAQYYLRFFERRQGRNNLTFSPRCEQAIAAYSWPGNLRELRNAVERAVILSPSNVVEAADLGLTTAVEGLAEGGGAKEAQGSRSRIALGDDVSIEEIEPEHIARVVARAPSFEAAARLLGIDTTTLQRKRKRYGLA